MMTTVYFSLRQRGFTLIEAVMVIVLTGVIGAMVAVFIKVPVQNYTDVVARAELSEAADGALRRMRRDVRLALPNSIRLSASGKSLEFFLVKTGGRYLSAEEGQTTRQALSFDNAASTTFDIIGTPPTGKQLIATTDSVVVYNIDQAPAEAYSGGNRAAVSAYDSATGRVTMASNPFAVQSPQMVSPTNRFQIVSSPVTYFCDGASSGGKLWRYDGYTPTTAQVDQPAGTAVLVANNVKSCVFTYDVAVNGPKALLSMTLELVDTGAGGGGTVKLSHFVHVDNTP